MKFLTILALSLCLSTAAFAQTKEECVSPTQAIEHNVKTASEMGLETPKTYSSPAQVVFLIAVISNGQADPKMKWTDLVVYRIPASNKREEAEVAVFVFVDHCLAGVTSFPQAKWDVALKTMPKG